MGSPKLFGVAAAITYCQRGVITAIPNDTLLGLTKWTFTQCAPYNAYCLRTVRESPSRWIGHYSASFLSETRAQVLEGPFNRDDNRGSRRVNVAQYSPAESVRENQFCLPWFYNWQGQKQ